jgi:hypothetical protein
MHLTMYNHSRISSSGEMRLIFLIVSKYVSSRYVTTRDSTFLSNLAQAGIGVIVSSALTIAVVFINCRSKPGYNQTQLALLSALKKLMTLTILTFCIKLLRHGSNELVSLRLNRA